MVRSVRRVRLRRSDIAVVTSASVVTKLRPSSETQTDTGSPQTIKVFGHAGAVQAAVAHRWGFAHVSRVSQAYRRMYGRPPVATLHHH
jgi:NAD/NADP transhydrogenase alpha subunit